MRIQCGCVPVPRLLAELCPMERRDRREVPRFPMPNASPEPSEPLQNGQAQRTAVAQLTAPPAPPMQAERRVATHQASGFTKLPHYFTAFQAFVIGQAEKETSRLPMPTAFLILEREATYRAEKPTKPGLFVYQLETIARNRLGYIDGFTAMIADPLYDDNWRPFIGTLARQMGDVDLADLVYLRSELYATEQRRVDAAYVSSLPPLFGEKEGKIARGSRTRDPLYLFAALQRQLGYPEVPRYKQRDDAKTKLDMLEAKMRELETRIKLAEGELRGSVDLSQFGKPDLLKDDE